jgi:hypothetical protein
MKSKGKGARVDAVDVCVCCVAGTDVYISLCLSAGMGGYFGVYGGGISRTTISSPTGKVCGCSEFQTAV